MNDATVEKLIIMGSGPAGYTAAIYAARAGLDPLLITGVERGGQLMTTTDVENWPGGAQGLLGPTLMTDMEAHATRLGVRMAPDHIESANLAQRPFTLTGGSGLYRTHSLIIATGASARYLGLDSETRFRGRGVSACATCDGFFFRNRAVAVVGGGNVALEEALYLSNIASSVHLIHRRHEFRAEHLLMQRVMEKAKVGRINIVWDHVVREIGGSEAGVEWVRISHAQRPGEDATLAVDGVFIAIGHKPNTGIFKGQIAMNNGYIIVRGGPDADSTATTVPGIFAAGDVMDSVYRQAITSAGSGCRAALDVERFLSGMKIIS